VVHVGNLIKLKATQYTFKGSKRKNNSHRF